MKINLLLAVIWRFTASCSCKLLSSIAVVAATNRRIYKFNVAGRHKFNLLVQPVRASARGTRKQPKTVWQLSNHKSELFYKPSSFSYLTISYPKPSTAFFSARVSFSPISMAFSYPIRTKFFSHVSKRILSFLRKTSPKTLIFSRQKKFNKSHDSVYPVHTLIELNKFTNQSINPSIDQLQWNHGSLIDESLWPGPAAQNTIDCLNQNLLIEIFETTHQF